MPSTVRPTPGARITCVICAYNEAPRIAMVLAAVTSHPLLDEVIVIDDGSTDGTNQVVARFANVRVISLPQNIGKSRAMAAGVTAAKHELLMLLDADLKGLTHDDVTALARPVLSGASQISLSLRKNSLLLFRLIGLDFVSGERVVPRALLGDVLEDIHHLPRFGIEMFMNRRIIARRMSISVIPWLHVSQARKTEKVGLWRGFRAECRMLKDLLDLPYPFGLISQSWHLLRLRVNSIQPRASWTPHPK